MKSENSKLLVGLGLGALVGVAIGCYLTAERRKKLEEDLREVGHSIKDGAKTVFSKVKENVEYAGAQAAGKAEEWAEKAGEKAGNWADKAGERASEMAEDVSQKANDLRRRMDNKAEMEGNKRQQYTENLNKDIDGMKKKYSPDGTEVKADAPATGGDSNPADSSKQ